MLGTALTVVLIPMLVGVLPVWGYSRRWGLGPSVAVGLMLLILFVLLMDGTDLTG